MGVERIVEGIRYYYLMCIHDYMTGVILHHVQQEVLYIPFIHDLSNAFYCHMK